MKQVPIEEFPPSVREAVDAAQKSHPLFGPGVVVCVAHTTEGRFAEAILANSRQVEQLAAALVDLGYLVSLDRLDSCDFVLDEDD